MTYGVKLFDENGRSWIDVVQPSWVWDVRSNISGQGKLNYDFDTSLFTLRVVVVNDVSGDHVVNAAFTVVGNTVSYNAPKPCTFIVFLETL